MPGLRRALWIGLDAFHDLLASEARGNQGESVSHRRATALTGEIKRYRACPECQQLMMPRQVGKSAIVVDICGQHGIWLDCDELSHLIAWMRGGGLKAVQEMIGNLKGSPDTIRKRLSSAAEPKSSPLPTPGGYGGPYEDWSGDRDRGNAEWFVEVGIPILAVLGSALAKMFLK